MLTVALLLLLETFNIHRLACLAECSNHKLTKPSSSIHHPLFRDCAVYSIFTQQPTQLKWSSYWRYHQTMDCSRNKVTIYVGCREKVLIGQFCLHNVNVKRSTVYSVDGCIELKYERQPGLFSIFTVRYSPIRHLSTISKCSPTGHYQTDESGVIIANVTWPNVNIATSNCNSLSHTITSEWFKVDIFNNLFNGNRGRQLRLMLSNHKNDMCRFVVKVTGYNDISAQEIIFKGYVSESSSVMKTTGYNNVEIRFQPMSLENCFETNVRQIFSITWSEGNKRTWVPFDFIHEDEQYQQTNKQLKVNKKRVDKDDKNQNSTRTRRKVYWTIGAVTIFMAVVFVVRIMLGYFRAQNMARQYQAEHGTPLTNMVSSSNRALRITAIELTNIIAEGNNTVYTTRHGTHTMEPEINTDILLPPDYDQATLESEEPPSYYVACQMNELQNQSSVV